MTSMNLIQMIGLFSNWTCVVQVNFLNNLFVAQGVYNLVLHGTLSKQDGF